jgi:hypothetical protein
MADAALTPIEVGLTAANEAVEADKARPAALFHFRREALQERPAPGLRLGGRS